MVIMTYPPQGINEVFTCVIDDDNNSKKHYLEAEKRLKKMERDYLHTNQKYTETRSQWQDLRVERRKALSRAKSLAKFIGWCKSLVERLQEALAELPKGETTEETIDRSLQFSMFNSGERIAQENIMVSQQKAQFQKLDRGAIQNFNGISRNLYDLRRKLPGVSRKVAHDLLKEDLPKEVTEKNKCRDKALSNYKGACNPTNHEIDRVRKSVELEIKVLKNLTRELQNDREERMHMLQCKKNIYKDLKQKVKHLEKQKDYISRQWDEENIIIRRLVDYHDGL